MALKELFYDRRPVAMLNPRESRRIDSRFRYSRLSEGMYCDADRVWKVAPPNVPRLHHDPVTGQYLGMLAECVERTNHIRNNTAVGVVVGTPGTPPTNWVMQTKEGLTRQVVGSGTEAGITYVDIRYSGVTASDVSSLIQPENVTAVVAAPGQSWSASAWLALVGGSLSGLNVTHRVTGRDSAGSFLESTATEPALTGSLTRYEVSRTFTNTAIERVTYDISLTNAIGAAIDITLRIGLPQLARGSRASTPIRTSGSTVTRSADVISIDSVAIPAAGTAVIDAQLTEVFTGSTLISLANASNQKVNLAVENRAATYNADVITASYTGQTKTSLPLPVPSTTRETSIITWGANNYQHARNISRFAPLLSGSVPTALNRMVIGQDAVDPTKGMMGLLNSVTLLPAEINDQLAEALVRTELVPINADTYTPTGPANALSMVINTQGSNNDGSTSFTFAVRRNSVVATALVSGQTYRILTTGTTNFTLIGAANSTAGTVFTATGPGTGTGTACLHHDIVITWGDNTESGLEGTAAEVGAVGLVHTYPSAGIYPVWVTGRADQIYFDNKEYAGDLLKIESWGTNDIFKWPRSMSGAFWGCINMTSIPASPIPDTSACTSFFNAFNGCSSLQTVPLFNTSACTTFQGTFNGCSSLTSIPEFNTANVTNFTSAFSGCTAITTTPLFNTSAVTSFLSAFAGCSSLNDLKPFNTANVTTFQAAFAGTAIVSTPTFNTANATILSGMYSGCSNLTGTQAFNTANCTTFADFTYNCTSLTSFPVIDTSKGTNFSRAWQGTKLSTFPNLTFTNLVTGTPADGYVGFRDAWYNCDLLTTFPANRFNTVTNCTQFTSAFVGCALTAASIENILVSINTANTSNGSIGLSGGTNADAAGWTAPAIAAYDAMIARGWTITRNA
jgi:surface protein